MKPQTTIIPTDLILPSNIVRSNPSWKKIYSAVRNGEYVVFLGPRFSGKTQILKDVLNTLQNEGNHICIVISFGNWHVYDQKQFYIKISEAVTAWLREEEKIPSKPLPVVRDSTDFRTFLSELAQAVPAITWVFAFTHLESIPRYLARALLRSLRVIYNERNARLEYERIVVVAVGALNLFDLSVSHSKISPFNIAKLVTLSDANGPESRQIIKFYGEAVGASFSHNVTEWIVKNSRGDRYIIEMLCRMTYLAARETNAESIRVTSWAKERVLQTLALEGEIQDTGLKERMRSIETDSAVLSVLLDILSNQNVRRRSLLTEIDEVELTGFFRFENNRYVFRNPLCELVLRGYFTPLRTARRLSTMGRWNESARYYEKLELSHLIAERSEYLTALVNQMYSVDDEEEVFEKIARAMENGFRVQWFNLYLYDEKNKKLNPITFTGSDKAALPASMDVYEASELMEPRAVIDNEFLLEEDTRGISVLAIPIASSIGQNANSANTGVIGLVTIYDQYRVDQFDRYQKEIWEISSFLSRASQAIYQIRERNKLLQNERHRLEVVRGLLTVMNAISGVLNLDELLKMVVNSVKAVLCADLVSMYLYNEDTETFVSPISIGNAKRDQQFAISAIPQINGLIVPAVFRKKKLRTFNRDFLRKMPILLKAGIASSAVCPLLIANKPIGILFVNYRSDHSFEENEKQVIQAFADQAAIAIQNAHLYTSEANRVRQLRAISEVATQMRIEDDPETVLRLALTGVTCGEGLGFSRAMYFALQEDEMVLEGQLAIGGLTKKEAEANWVEAKGTNLAEYLLAVRSWNKGPHGELDAAVRKVRFPISGNEGALAESIVKKKAILVRDATQDPGVNRFMVDELFSNSFATIPFIVKGRPMGVLVIDQRYLPYQITENDLPMVETLADLAAIAIENAMLIRRMEGFAEIAHQLRSPLMDIRGRMQLLTDGVITKTEKVQNYYQVILGVIESFESSINQMLSLQKIEAGHYEFFFKESSVRNIIQHALEANRYGASQKEIEIEVKFNHSNDVIFADEDKLISSIQALLENAIKFSLKKTMVYICTRDLEAAIEICVIDHGLGINAEDIPHLGERHYRGKIAREQRIDGIGLGLMIIRYVVDGHHGILDIRSAPGKGSTFRIEIPQQRVA